MVSCHKSRQKMERGDGEWRQGKAGRHGLGASVFLAGYMDASVINPGVPS